MIPIKNPQTSLSMSTSEISKIPKFFLKDIVRWLEFSKLRISENIHKDIEYTRGLSFIAVWNILQIKKELQEYKESELFETIPFLYRSVIEEIEEELDFCFHSFPIANLNKFVEDMYPITNDTRTQKKLECAKNTIKQIFDEFKIYEKLLLSVPRDFARAQVLLQDLEALEKTLSTISDQLSVVNLKKKLNEMYAEHFGKTSYKIQKQIWQEISFDFDTYFLHFDKQKKNSEGKPLQMENFLRLHMGELLTELEALAINDEFKREFQEKTKAYQDLLLIIYQDKPKF